MKKVLAIMIAVGVAGVASADIFTALGAGFGISGNGANGGLVEPVQGTTIVLQLIDGGGDGLDYASPGLVQFDLLGTAIAHGNDTILGTLAATVTDDAVNDYSDWAGGISGVITGPWTADAYYRVSGVMDGDWVYESSVVTFQDIDTSDPLAVPEGRFFDEDGAGGAADGSVTVEVIPEPAAIGLMGVAGLGLFLARRKARR